MKLFNDFKSIMTSCTPTQKVIAGTGVAGNILIYGGLIGVCVGAVAVKTAVIAGAVGGVMLVGTVVAATVDCHKHGCPGPFGL